MNINKILSSKKNIDNKKKVKEINKKIKGRVCHDRISILPVLFDIHGNLKI